MLPSAIASKHDEEKHLANLLPTPQLSEHRTQGRER
jgi:hypothetical protein